jgi:hypothetical protein
MKSKALKKKEVSYPKLPRDFVEEILFKYGRSLLRKKIKIIQKVRKINLIKQEYNTTKISPIIQIFHHKEKTITKESQKMPLEFLLKCKFLTIYK